MEAEESVGGDAGKYFKRWERFYRPYRQVYTIVALVVGAKSARDITYS